MIQKTERIRDGIFGDRNKITSERYFVTLTTFVAAIFSVILGLFHFFSSLKVISVILAFATAILLFGLYYAVRFYRYLFVPKIILTIGCLLILDVTFYTKYLSNGPILLFILIFAALILLIWSGRPLTLLILVYFLNLGALFYLDYNAPDSLLEYPSPQKRSIDVYSSIIIYSTLLVSLLYIFKLDYLKQKKKAVESERLKSAFLANISHEIRTPMNGILGFSELLKDSDLKPETKARYIEIIEVSGIRMLNTINDVIDISKIEAGLIGVNLQPSNLTQLLQNVYNDFGPEVAANGMELVCENLNDSLALSVNTDGDKLSDILVQLIKNAIKYSSKGTIAFGYRFKGNYIEFYVKDEGIGVEMEKQQAIFERFVQADIEDVQARQGAGLGLFIAKSYVELLGGEIWLESKPGAGSNFYFTIPR